MVESAPRIRQIALLARSVASALELQAVLDEVTAAVTALRPDAVCAIRLVDTSLGGYRLARTGGPTIERRAAIVPFGQGLTHMVAEQRASLLVESLPTHPRAIAGHWSIASGMPIYLGVPIEAGGDLLGVLNVNFSPGAPPSVDDREFIEALAGQAAVALRNARLFAEAEDRRTRAETLAAENARLYAEALQRRRQAEELARVARALAERLDVAEIVAQIEESVRTLFDVRSGLLAMAEPDGTLVVFAAFGAASTHFPPGTRLATGEGTSGRAFATGRPAWSDDVQGEAPELRAEELRRRNHTADIRAALAVPLIAKGRRIGVLAVADQIPRPFAEDEVATLQAFADQVALALDNARLYAEAERRFEEAEELARVARVLTSSLDTAAVADRIVQGVLPLFRARSASLRLLQPDGSLVVIGCAGPLASHLPLGQSTPLGIGLPGLVAREQRALWSRDLLGDPRITMGVPGHERIATLGGAAALGVPLRVNGHLIGVLTITDTTGRAFTESEVTLLQTFANQAAVAIDNARLYAVEKRRAEEQAILLTIVRDLGSTVELGSVLGVIAQRAAQAVGMERCSVFLWREGRLEGVTSQYADGRAASDVWGQVRTRLAADLAELPALTEWLRTAGIVMIDDTASHSAVPRWWVETLRLRSVLIVPLAHQSTAIGLLYFDNTSQAGGITQDQTILATTIASQMALAAENADLYRALRRQLTASEGLVAVARTLAQSLDVQELVRQAMRELTRLLGADTSVFFGERDPEGFAHPVAGYRVPSGHRDPASRISVSELPPAIIEALRTGQPVATSDPLADARFVHPMLRSGALEPESLLFTPVVAGDRPRGGIVTIWWSRRHEFSRDDFNLAAGVASQLALALENARLYRSVQGALDEARSAQAEMARTETLRALGQFADGAAHHLNNLLAVALGRIQLALLKRAPVEAASELTTAQKAIRDSADIIRRLHDFGAGRPLGPLELVNLNDVVRAADADAPVVWQDEVARRGTSIELALAEDLPVVNAVRKPLQEALRNLIVNAVEAIPSSGSIVIRTWAEASSVYCAVIDHGVGMSGEIARRAIEPFFTTKGLQRRGLGLSASHGIIARHGGELRVESHMGQGTTVTVRLPIAHAPDQV